MSRANPGPSGLHREETANLVSGDLEIEGSDPLDASNVEGSEVTLTDQATIAIDCNTDGLVWKVTLGGNRAFGNPTNAPTAGSSWMMEIVQDGTGSRIPTWGSSWHAPGGTAPTLTTTANGVDHIAGKVNSDGKFVIFGDTLDTKVIA